MPGVKLNGSGQYVGLVEMDGFYASDIRVYETRADLPNVPITVISLSGSSGYPDNNTNAVAEVSLDIEMVISMAPGLAGLYVFEGNSYDEILGSMATYAGIKQFSSSFVGYGFDSSGDNLLRSNAVAQFESDGFQGAMVTTNDAIALQTQISTHGLPAGLLDALTGLGADSQTITNIQNNLLTADAGTLAGSFPESLVNTNFDLAAQTLASAMRDASLRLMNASLLPGGQLRFDLPTEPGYVYTIQFAQNLGNPAGWTTLFTNHATTLLTSFTNTLPPNAPAGFYRASHN